MPRLLALTICFAVLAALAFSAVAQDKEVTLTGKVTCSKCDLKKDANCATVLVVKEGTKDAIYYLDEKTHKAYHDTVCQGGKQGTVHGRVLPGTPRLVECSSCRALPG